MYLKMLTIIILYGAFVLAACAKNNLVSQPTEEVCEVNGNCNSLEIDKELGKELRQIEQEHLKGQLTPDARKKPELVHYIEKNFIHRALEEYRSDVAHMGSNYEFTSVPGISDYDIQFFFKLQYNRNNRKKNAVMEECDDPAWRVVKGGPFKLLNEDGYLCASKARRLIQSEIDKSLKIIGSTLKFEGSVVEIRRSTSGPATTLNVKWRSIKLGIDIVICLKAEDLGNSGGHDLVGKPYKEDNSKKKSHYWRLSYSRKEIVKLREYHKRDERKITLLRIMKVIKQYQPQLGYFPSYFYKNILFKLDEDMPNASWDRDSLPARFKDMIRVIHEAVKTKTLYLHFNKKVNYLVNKDAKKLKEIATYLKGIMDNNRYVDLVRSVKATIRSRSSSIEL